jgi:hypothetical protein
VFVYRYIRFMEVYVALFSCTYHTITCWRQHLLPEKSYGIMDLLVCYNANMRELAMLYLLVGLPGAGKTTKARQLEVSAPNANFAISNY